MIQGFFIGNPPNVPIIQLTISWKNMVLQPAFILDTGFSGDIKITQFLANELGLKPHGYESITTADNTEVICPIAISDASIEEVKKSVEVLIGQGFPLAGIGLLKKFGYKAIVDCKNENLYIQKVV